MPPALQHMPRHGLHLLRSLDESGWNPQVAYGAGEGGVYWQVMGTWEDVRVEGWWRSSALQSWQWRGVRLVKVRARDHDPEDFRAIEPKDDAADIIVPIPISNAGLTAHVLNPGRFVDQVMRQALTAQ